jgi:hypothetical protein
MTSSNKPPGLWVGQSIHIICGSLFLLLTWIAWTYLGKPFPIAFWVAVVFPVAHQVFVWLAWRLELRSSATSKTIGFQIYVICFFMLFGCRFLSLVLLTWLDNGSLCLGITFQIILTIILCVPGLYAMYSVKRYFGMVRASGADHFDHKYRDLPLVKKGIFRFTSNGMYIYAFLLFWAIAIGFNSAAGVVVAAFSHAYIWVHFFATEKPDMAYLYTKK